MTTSEPDPRTDLAGYLGLDADDIEECRIDAIRYPKVLTGKVGARLIEQDQARADEPGDGLHAMLDIDALGGAKHLRETMCVAQGAVLREAANIAAADGRNVYADTIQAIIDVCDQHRPLGPDGKHGTRRCTPTCGCIDKRDPEPDDGLIPVTDPEPVEGPPGTVPVTLWLTAQEVSGEGEGWDSAVDKLCDACAAIDLPAPKPPWTSPLPNLPDLTEQQCRDAYDAGIDPDRYDPWAQIGRALKAAGWTPVEEADRG